MMEKIKNFSKTKLFKIIIVPILLICLWATLTLFYIISFDSSLLILPYNHPNADIKILTFQPLTKGKMIEGVFTATENNLGIIQLRFNYHEQIAYNDEDNLLFRIREVGARGWYYQSIYKSGLVSDVPFLPFGFPQIANSKGKQYEFQLISENGNVENAVSLKNRFPIFISKYKIYKANILANKTAIFYFIENKYERGLENSDILFSSVIYGLPLIFYLLLISPLGKYLVRPGGKLLFIIFKKLDNTTLFGQKLLVITRIKNMMVSYFDLILLVLIFLDIFIMQVLNDMIYIVILILWWWIRKLYKKDENGTFIMGIFFIFLTPFLLAFDLNPAAETSTIWGYVFLLTWFIQIISRTAVYTPGRRVTYRI